jgi:hypothetical protein
MIISALVIIITLAALYLIEEATVPPKKKHCADCASCVTPCGRHKK